MLSCHVHTTCLLLLTPSHEPKYELHPHGDVTKISGGKHITSYNTSHQPETCRDFIVPTSLPLRHSFTPSHPADPATLKFPPFLPRFRGSPAGHLFGGIGSPFFPLIGRTDGKRGQPCFQGKRLGSQPSDFLPRHTTTSCQPSRVTCGHGARGGFGRLERPVSPPGETCRPDQTNGRTRRRTRK